MELLHAHSGPNTISIIDDMEDISSFLLSTGVASFEYTVEHTTHMFTAATSSSSSCLLYFEFAGVSVEVEDMRNLTIIGTAITMHSKSKVAADTVPTDFEYFHAAH